MNWAQVKVRVIHIHDNIPFILVNSSGPSVMAYLVIPKIIHLIIPLVQQDLRIHTELR